MPETAPATKKGKRKLTKIRPALTAGPNTKAPEFAAETRAMKMLRSLTSVTSETTLNHIETPATYDWAMVREPANKPVRARHRINVHIS